VRRPEPVKVYRERVTPWGVERLTPTTILDCGEPSIFDLAASEWLRIHEAGTSPSSGAPAGSPRGPQTQVANPPGRTPRAATTARRDERQTPTGGIHSGGRLCNWPRVPRL
jgi:hypothetical protein